MATSRRSFLRMGGVAALVLAAGGGVYRVVNGPAPPTPFVLDGEARAAIDAMAAAMLGGALPPDPSARAAAIASSTARVHQTILGLAPGAQKELRDLFGLLAIGPVRRLLAGVPEAWSSAPPHTVAAFLQRWRTHRFGMLAGAYAALHDLILGSWYADPANWAAIGYAGPLKELSA
jgi:hypothetical protein